MMIKTQPPPIARGGVGIPVRPSGKQMFRPRVTVPLSPTDTSSRIETSMLGIHFTCGWHASGETKQELLEKARAHVLFEHTAEALDEGVLRRLIAERARPVGEGELSGKGSQRGGAG